MLTERRDYLLRLIQEAGAAARRLRELLTGEDSSGSVAATDLIAREAEQAVAALLGGGTQAELLARVDADTAVRLIADAERVRAWVALLEVQADALQRSGADVAMRRVRERAHTLADAATRLGASLGS